MENLSLNLKLFYVEDGESYYILAKDEEQARDYYENSGECIDDSSIESMIEENKTNEIIDCYSIKEIKSDTDSEITINEDEGLLTIVNLYSTEKINSINVFLYAKYTVLESELRLEQLKVPMMIAGSVCS